MCKKKNKGEGINNSSNKKKKQPMISGKNYREVIIEIGNDIYIHNLLNPEWKENLKSAGKTNNNNK